MSTLEQLLGEIDAQLGLDLTSTSGRVPGEEVQRRRNRASGTIVSVVYWGEERSPEAPWATICDTHGSILVNQTLKLARYHAAFPEWCEDCQPILEAKGLL